MSLDRIQQEIRSLREEFDARLDALLKAVEAEAGDNPLPKLMKTAAYAKHADVCVSTAKRWIKDGMPVYRRGNAVRVKVAEADAWRDAETARIRASAEHDAHRGTK